MKVLGYALTALGTLAAIGKISNPIHALYFIGIFGGLGLACGLYFTVRRSMMR